MLGILHLQLLTAVILLLFTFYPLKKSIYSQKSSEDSRKNRMCLPGNLFTESIIGVLNMQDQILEAVRKHHLAHTRKFKDDFSAIYDDQIRIQLESGHKIIRYAQKKHMPKTYSHVWVNRISG